MEKTRTSTEMNSSWPEDVNQLSDSDMMSDCIDCRTNTDGTLDYVPVPLAIKNLWLFKNGGQRNEVC